MQKVLGDCALCYLFSKMLAVLIRKKIISQKMNEKQQKKCAITCFAWNMVAQISFSIIGKKNINMS